MKHLFPLLALMLFITQLATGQTALRFAEATAFVENKNTEPFVISTHPVTNREYLLFLIWNYEVYGINYPENIIQLLPGNLGDTAFYNALQRGESPFKNWYNHAEPFVRDYMLNPEYLDYPVIGITWFQASKCCHWLSDRYNEFFLIKNNYLKFDSYQSNEECFISESYLADQFYGLRLVEKTPVWSDRLMLPCFRLPTSKELLTAKTTDGFQTAFRSYPPEPEGFLSLWNNYYLQQETDKMIIKHAFGMNDTLNIDVINPDYKVKEYSALTLDRLPEQKNLSVPDIFVQSGQALTAASSEFEKDSVGQMQYIIIGETADQKPVAVALYANEPDPDGTYPFYERKPIVAMTDAEMRCFYWACSIKKGQFANH